jgi:hypothetical protein
MLRPSLFATISLLANVGATLVVALLHPQDYGVNEITIWFSTSLTPGADQAASSAAFLSA